MVPLPCIFKCFDLRSGPRAVLLGEQNIVILIALERRIEIDKINSFVLAVAMENVQVVAVVESIHYFGHPSGGFFFNNDLLIATRQSPSILRRSGFGPRFAEAALTRRFGVFRMVVYAASGFLYRNRLPSADRIANAVRSPSFNVRLFHRKSNCHR